MPEYLSAMCLTMASPISAKASRGTQARQSQTVGKIAIIPVFGPIMQRRPQPTIRDEIFGGFCGSTTEEIGNALADANADPSVSQILLEIDSPGGSVYGVETLAAQIRVSRKPVVAFANSLAASAAYWLGSAASEFYMTPGGEVGSIGVYMVHADESGALEKEGRKVTLISAGDNKTEGNPYAPLAPAAKKFIQSRVDDYYGQFTRDVAKGRGTTASAVRSDMGKGRCYGAAQAKAAGMVDGVLTMNTLVGHMFKGSSPKRAIAQAEREEYLARMERQAEIDRLAYSR